MRHLTDGELDILAEQNRDADDGDGEDIGPICERCHLREAEGVWDDVLLCGWCAFAGRRAA